MSKRIQSFFQPISKEPKPDPSPDHPLSALASTKPPKPITTHPHLDLLYFQPLLSPLAARALFHFLWAELPFYRVQYTIRRGPTQTKITTPRYTTVFGIDTTSYFHTAPITKTQTPTLHSKSTNLPNPSTKYKCTPRPIPPCLEALRLAVQSATHDTVDYNFILVNYYATGDDSIAYHSDDERFLGPSPAIASLSLGAERDFLLKHKPGVEAGPLKFPLGSGDMVVMRGEEGECRMGRINVTFRRALVPGGTKNYYRYNVGEGAVWRWGEEVGRMVCVDGEG
ncbi:uncharacterized protein BDW43DRAFT_305017 [Aspergillus alliaceus]|uniref:uncharacterized protein n=1 Tax=Petromyces alliaceus TaxID=209559 RepID=UPI0012A63F43|nr:uncharacterized protein BDW43DRAFT_305017 [Aspergillus alliaceus]KAB8226881.1 hypothetical protein BDW43DRAFT_305017 [Aspergillus alliaceus]